MKLGFRGRVPEQLFQTLTERKILDQAPELLLGRVLCGLGADDVLAVLIRMHAHQSEVDRLGAALGNSGIGLQRLVPGGETGLTSRSFFFFFLIFEKKKKISHPSAEAVTE